MASVWQAVVGQQRAIAQLTAAAVDPVHAYLFVGPAGSTKDEASRAFAGLLLAGIDDADQRDARLALAGEHPDVREVVRAGATISKEQIAEIIRNASLAPVEGSRKVMILHEFHLLDATAAARLLKTLEEPPPGTVFIVLADQVTNDLVTIASRCVRIDFARLSADTIAGVLRDEGVGAEAAAVAASAAEGNLTRARLLGSDQGVAERRAAFAGVPGRLTGEGNAVVTLVNEISALIDGAAEALTARHMLEVADVDARIAALGERGSGRKQLEERHKRELRRHRTDELRSGLGVIAGMYRDALVAGHMARPESAANAVNRIHDALESLERSPNETLLLQALLLDLPALTSTALPR